MAVTQLEAPLSEAARTAIFSSEGQSSSGSACASAWHARLIERHFRSQRLHLTRELSRVEIEHLPLDQAHKWLADVG